MQATRVLRHLNPANWAGGRRNPESIGEVAPVSEPQVLVDDPKFQKVTELAEEIYTLTTFSRLKPDASLQKATIPLLGSDLGPANIVRRFLPSSVHRGLEVTINRLHLPERESLNVYLNVPIVAGENQPPVYSRLQVWAPDEKPYSKRVYFSRKPYLASAVDITGQKNANPVLALEQIRDVVGNLRTEFAKDTVEKADELLNPMQRGLVRAIRERGMEAVENSGDQFVLFGNFDRDNKLFELEATFSTENADPANAEWRETDFLDGLPVSWSNHGRDLSGNIHAYIINGGFMATGWGELSVIRRQQRHRLLAGDYMGIHLTQVPGGQGVVSQVGERFNDFLRVRIGAQSNHPGHILLATSVPVV